jgi:hypothetical protein
MDENRPSSLLFLILGDMLVILLVTLIGFANHGEISAVPRMFTTFLPLCLGWGLAAGLLGLYRADRTADARSIWLPAAAAVLGVPLAAWLRGAWLDSPIVPIFVLVLVSAVAVFMTVWRAGWMLLQRRQASHG